MNFQQNGFEQTDRILRYLQGELQGEELERFEKWLAEDKANRDLIQKLQDSAALQEKLDFMGSLDTEAAWNKVASRTTGRPANVVPIRARVWLHAAAVVLLLVGGWALLKFAGKEQTSPPRVQVMNTNVGDSSYPSPGEDKARLVLSDGSVIVLDNESQGTVRQEKGYKLSQQDGEVVYEVSSAAAGLPLTFHTLSTPAGGQFRIVLPDGSRAWLNAASSLRFPTQFKGNERTVVLTGEAYFEIARNEQMPFKVAVGDIGIEVLGTHFNVMAYDNEGVVRTTLLEGSVRVQKGGQRKILKPGFEATVQRENINVARVDVQGAVAWKEGRFQFQETDLQTIMRQIERWYDVEVYYEEGVKEERFSGIIPRSASAAQVLEMLELTKTVKFKIEGKKIRVSPYK